MILCYLLVGVMSGYLRVIPSRISGMTWYVVTSHTLPVLIYPLRITWPDEESWM